MSIYLELLVKMKKHISISFIVIGKNEGTKLLNCIKSIKQTVQYNKLKNIEIIYIDSNSTDNSIELIKQFSNLKIFKLTNYCNSAIARNLGFKKSSGNILFFIDGDMELIPENLSNFYNIKKNELYYPFISGGFINNYYSKSGELIYKKDYTKLKKDEFQVTTGGIFLITRNLWLQNNGMRNEFRRSQDLDFGLRLSKKGIKLLRKNIIIANHHTIEYNSDDRFWNDLFKGNFLYQGLLYKKNILNLNIYKKYVFKEISLFIMIFTLFISSSNFNLLMLYPIALICKIIFKKETPSFIVKYLLLDINTLVSLIFFWPKQINDAPYVEYL